MRAQRFILRSVILKLIVTWVVLLSVLPSGAQTIRADPAIAQPRFAVATVRVSRVGTAGGENSRGESRPGESIEHSPGSLTMRNVSLRSCIVWAYQVKDYQISGPAWLAEERYDIAGKAADPVPLAELQPMLRTLLSERLGVRIHRERKEFPVYALVGERSGLKFRAATGDGDSEMRMNMGSLVFKHTSMAQFADHLEIMNRVVDRPVIDRTGLRGVFDFTLKFGESDAGMSSIFALVQEQLGLKLEPRQGRVETIVIDHAEKVPTPN